MFPAIPSRGFEAVLTGIAHQSSCKVLICSKVRNPIYLFSGLVLAGLSLFLSIWGPLAVAVVLIPLQVRRARKEERVLAAAFGEKYQIYKRNTWF
jgi:protein-S-isoprenylcysteine O-methyltransferase Ste14